jgi:uncharacterized protein (DUF1501 family)
MTLVSRRSLLGSSLGWVSLGLGPKGTAHAVVAPPTTPSPPEALIVVRLRGGADSLSLLVPHGDDDYRRARRTTSVRYPSQRALSDLQLERGYALHPALAPLKAWFDEGELGAILGVGPSHLMCSHRDAVQEMDAALRSALPGSHLELGPGSPSRQARRWVEALTTGKRPLVLMHELEGWDVHAAQGGASGRHAAACATLASELAALRAVCRQHANRALVVVLTEFGRSLRETPLRGTDDGHGSVALVLGEAGYWGRVFGVAPVLRPEALVSGRYLPAPLAASDLIARLARGERAF